MAFDCYGIMYADAYTGLIALFLEQSGLSFSPRAVGVIESDGYVARIQPVSDDIFEEIMRSHLHDVLIERHVHEYIEAHSFYESCLFFFSTDKLYRVRIAVIAPKNEIERMVRERKAKRSEPSLLCGLKRVQHYLAVSDMDAVEVAESN